MTSLHALTIVLSVLTFHPWLCVIQPIIFYYSGRNPGYSEIPARVGDTLAVASH